jgi:protein-L-isoaspartate(D-aspartate) O-methyltransferase
MPRLAIFSAAAIVLTSCTPASPTPTAALAATATRDGFGEARNRLMQDGLASWGIAEGIVRVIGEVPRHEFVPAEFLDQAYENHPLPIGYGQTISQPYIVALMTEALQFEVGDRILEIGTGSGYQAAVLAALGAEVYTIEIIPPLAEQAARRLEALGYRVTATVGDGYFGWPEHAPFDGIIVTAAPDHVPPPLLDQLGIGAVLVIPVGPPGGYQELWRITRTSDEDYASVSLGGVRFVPLVREVP